MTGPRVLVVDDEPQIQRLLTVALNAAGFQVQTAKTGAQALRLAATAAPDVIVLDLGLPDRDGKDVLRDIRQFSTTPVIILSARDREAEKIEALDLGADDYVEKPFGIGELTARLRAALRHAAHAIERAQRVEINGVVMDFDKRLVTSRRDSDQAHAQGIRPARRPVSQRRQGRDPSPDSSYGLGASASRGYAVPQGLHWSIESQDRTRSHGADDCQNGAWRRLPRRRGLARSECEHPSNQIRQSRAARTTAWKVKDSAL